MQGRERTAFTVDGRTVDSNETRGSIAQDRHSLSVARPKNFI